MKKVLALVLAATMILGTAVMASASIPLVLTGSAASGDFTIGLTDETNLPANKASASVGGPIYTYDSGSVSILVYVKYGRELRVDVGSGDVTENTKRVARDKAAGIDTYKITISPDAGVRDYGISSWKVEIDLYELNRVYFITGDVGYSDWRDISSDERHIIMPSGFGDVDNDNGSIFYFGEVIDDEVRVICNDYVDLFFNGNYDTDYENLRVTSNVPSEVEDFFGDIDLDGYKFVASPKFATSVDVRIDADPDSFIYEYDAATGDLTDITDECDYTSDGWTFTRKVLGHYIIAEEPYEGGNVLEEDAPVEEPVDDTAAQGSKPNPGTGAPVL